MDGSHFWKVKGFITNVRNKKRPFEQKLMTAGFT